MCSNKLLKYLPLTSRFEPYLRVTIKNWICPCKPFGSQVLNFHSAKKSSIEKDFSMEKVGKEKSQVQGVEKLQAGSFHKLF